MSVSQISTQEVIDSALSQKDMQVRMSIICLAKRLISSNDIAERNLQSIRKIVEEQMSGHSIVIPALEQPSLTIDERYEQVQSFLCGVLEYTSEQLSSIEDVGVTPEEVVSLVYALWLFFEQQHQQYGDSAEERKKIESNLEFVFNSVPELCQEQIIRLLPKPSWSFVMWLLDFVALTSDTLRCSQEDLPYDVMEQMTNQFEERHSLSL